MMSLAPAILMKLKVEAIALVKALLSSIKVIASVFPANIDIILHFTYSPNFNFDYELYLNFLFYKSTFSYRFYNSLI